MKQGRRAQKFFLPHWWTSVIWRMPNWRQSTKNTKVELYSEATSWKMILDLLQYLQNKGHQHHKWQQQKSWISYSDCQGAQDKQRTQYVLKPCQNGRRSTITENSQIGRCRLLDSSTTTQMAQIMVQYGRPSRSSWAKSVWSPFGRTIVGKAICENPIEIRLGESSKLGMSLCTSWKRIILICVCGWHQNWLQRNKILIRCGNYGTKKSNLGEPTSFLDHVHLGCTQRQCEISKNTVDNYRTMFESRISAKGTEKLPFPQNLRISSWSYDMDFHAKDCVERFCELANKTTQQLYKKSTPRIDDHHFQEEELKSVGELSQVCSQIVLKCLHLARIGRPDILWSVNKLARSITKCTKACDKRLNRLISYIHHTCEYKQYCYVGNTAKQCRLGMFQDSDFAGYLEDSKSASGGTLCIFGSHTFVPISWMCKKQTSVSHSSTESEIISLDAGLRMDGKHALDLWDLIVSVLGKRIRAMKNRATC